MVMKEVLEKQGYRSMEKRILISALILIIAIVIFLAFVYFIKPKECNDSACFQKALSNCNRVSYVKEDSKASWHYIITNSNGKNSCNIRVKLLKMNQGTIETEILEGTEMTCIINKADTRPPEENMQSCTGLLKEKLQEIIIERMHSYLLKNLGEIKESFTP